MSVPPASIVFTAEGLDRRSDSRNDKAWLEAAFAAQDSRLYLFFGDVPVMKAGSPLADPLWRADEASRFGAGHETVFLGLEGKAPRFARRLEPLTKTETGFVYRGEALDDPALLISDLRSIVLRASVLPHHLPPLAQAKALLFWHQRHGFCANCGHKSEVAEAGWRRDCPNCHAPHFPRTDPVVIMLATRGEYCLMGRSKHFAPLVYSSLAGFMEPGETIEQAVRREIFEESGISTGHVRQIADQPWPFPSSLMIACMAEATSDTIIMDGELEDCRWFHRDECRLMLAGNHPDGLMCPPVIGISNFLITGFAAGTLG